MSDTCQGCKKRDAENYCSKCKLVLCTVCTENDNGDEHHGVLLSDHFKSLLSLEKNILEGELAALYGTTGNIVKIGSLVAAAEDTKKQIEGLEGGRGLAQYTDEQVIAQKKAFDFLKKKQERRVKEVKARLLSVEESIKLTGKCRASVLLKYKAEDHTANFSAEIVQSAQQAEQELISMLEASKKEIRVLSELDRSVKNTSEKKRLLEKEIQEIIKNAHLKLEAIDRDVKSKSNELTSLTNSCEQALDQQRNQKMQAEKEIGLLKAEIKTLKKDKEKGTTSLTSLQARNKTADSEYQSKVKMNADLAAQLSKLESKYEQTIKEKDYARSEMQMLSKQIEEQKGLLFKIHKDMAVSQSGLSSLTSEIKEAQQRLEILKKENAEQRELANAHEKEAKQKASAMVESTTAKDSTMPTKEDISIPIAVLLGISNKLAFEEKRHQSLLHKNEEMQANYDKSCLTLQSTRKKLEEQAEDAKKALNVLEEQKSEKQKCIDSMLKKLEEVEQAKKKFKSDIQSAEWYQIKKNNLDKEIETVTKSKDSIAKELAQLQEELESKSKVKETLNNSIEDLKKQECELINGIEKLSARRKNDAIKIQDLLAKVKSLKVQHEDIKRIQADCAEYISGVYGAAELERPELNKQNDINAIKEVAKKLEAKMKAAVLYALSKARDAEALGNLIGKQTRKIDSQIEQHKIAEDKIALIKKELTNQEEAKTRLTQELAKLTAENETCAAELYRLKSDKTAFTTAVEKIRLYLKGKREIIASSFSELPKKIKKASEVYLSLKSTYPKIIKFCAEMSQEVADIKKKSAEAKSELDKIQEQNKAQNDALSLGQVELEKLTNKCKRCKGALNKIHKTLVSTAKEYELLSLDMETQKNETSEALDEIKNALTQLGKKAREIEIKRKKEEEKYKSTKAEEIALSRDCRSKSDKLEQVLRAEFNQLKQEEKQLTLKLKEIEKNSDKDKLKEKKNGININYERTKVLDASLNIGEIKEKINHIKQLKKIHELAFVDPKDTEAKETNGCKATTFEDFKGIEDGLEENLMILRVRDGLFVETYKWNEAKYTDLEKRIVELPKALQKKGKDEPSDIIKNVERLLYEITSNTKTEAYPFAAFRNLTIDYIKEINILRSKIKKLRDKPCSKCTEKEKKRN